MIKELVLAELNGFYVIQVSLLRLAIYSTHVVCVRKVCNNFYPNERILEENE